MDKYFAIHTTEPKPEDRRLMILHVKEDGAKVLLHDYGKDRPVIAEEVQESDLDKILDQYKVGE